MQSYGLQARTHARTHTHTHTHIHTHTHTHSQRARTTPLESGAHLLDGDGAVSVHVDLLETVGHRRASNTGYNSGTSRRGKATWQVVFTSKKTRRPLTSSLLSLAAILCGVKSLRSGIACTARQPACYLQRHLLETVHRRKASKALLDLVSKNSAARMALHPGVIKDLRLGQPSLRKTELMQERNVTRIHNTQVPLKTARHRQRSANRRARSHKGTHLLGAQPFARILVHHVSDLRCIRRERGAVAGQAVMAGQWTQ
jgi:hypothetical protein